jgi:hypothetical protein
MRFTDMDKPSLGKDFLKITYKIKPKGMASEKEKEPEAESESESSPSDMLRQAADMIEEGNIQEAYDVIDEAVAMCQDMHGEGEDEGEDY